MERNLEGVPQPHLGDLLTMVIKHLRPSWDDPPSKAENLLCLSKVVEFYPVNCKDR